VSATSRLGAILLSGAVGSGKTTLLLEIGEILDELGERYALVDLDWLAWLRLAPDATPTVHDVLIENLRAVCGTYRRAGVQRLALARFLERREQLDAIRQALGDVDIFAVRLAVPEHVLQARLRQRDTGTELAEHLALVADTADLPPFEDAVVTDTGVRRPRDIALEILDRAAWLTAIEPHKDVSAQRQRQ
jgi:hypothetical protein